jgi:hypothetical protein
VDIILLFILAATKEAIKINAFNHAIIWNQNFQPNAAFVHLIYAILPTKISSAQIFAFFLVILLAVSHIFK